MQIEIKGRTYSPIFKKGCRKVIGFIDDKNEEILRSYNEYILYSADNGARFALYLDIEPCYFLLSEILKEIETDFIGFIKNKSMTVERL